jgi:hypothetical protein
MRFVSSVRLRAGDFLDTNPFRCVSFFFLFFFHSCRPSNSIFGLDDTVGTRSRILCNLYSRKWATFELGEEAKAIVR